MERNFSAQARTDLKETSSSCTMAILADGISSTIRCFTSLAAFTEGQNPSRLSSDSTAPARIEETKPSITNASTSRRNRRFSMIHRKMREGNDTDLDKWGIGQTGDEGCETGGADAVGDLLSGGSGSECAGVADSSGEPNEERARRQSCREVVYRRRWPSGVDRRFVS